MNTSEIENEKQSGDFKLVELEELGFNYEATRKWKNAVGPKKLLSTIGFTKIGPGGIKTRSLWVRAKIWNKFSLILNLPILDETGKKVDQK